MPGALLVEKFAPVFALSGNEITDATRALGIQGDGRQNDSSVGIWAAATNLNPNGSAETDATRTGGAGAVTRARDLTQAKFGASSFRLTTAAELADGFNWWHNDLTATEAGVGHGIPAVAGQTYTLSAWIKIPTALGGGTGGTKSVRLRLIEWNDAGAVIKDNNVAPNLLATVGSTFDWVRATYTITMQATTTNVSLRVNCDRTIGDVYVDGMQFESGAIATPYVHTDGAAATRAAGRVQHPSSVLAAAQGWVALRVRVGWGAAAAPTASPMFWEWRNDGNNRVGLFYGQAQQKWGVSSIVAGVNVTKFAANVSTHAAGDFVTLIFAWGAFGIAISVNGGAFVTQASALPALTAALADIGNAAGTSSWIDSDVHWYACGTGTLVDADANTINQAVASGREPHHLADLAGFNL